MYLWQAVDPSLVHTQSWDDEIVLYDLRSGQTHHLSLFGGALLMLMFRQTGLASGEDWSSQLAAVLELDRDAQFDQTLAESLDQFQALSLIEGIEV